MRLGAAGGPRADTNISFFRAETPAELDGVAEKLDTYGLSAVVSPFRTAEMTEDECIEFGEKAASLDIIISEVHFLENLHSSDPEIADARLAEARSLLRKADLMRARCLIGFAGGAHPSGNRRIPCPENFSDSFKAAVRERVLRVLDGLDLKWTKYGLEASNKNFFYEPEDCAEFIASVDHPDFGLHLDMMNMISQATLYKTTDVINRTFELMKDRIFAAHLKDISWDWTYQFLKFDEVLVGDGLMDYPTFIGHLATMDGDFPCMCEHLVVEADYVKSFDRLHTLATDLGASWIRRGSQVSV
jgi:sugar phosphate isomerase/epimerase